MAAKKSKHAKEKASQSKNLFLNSAHQIWLAGLGALARAQKEGPKLFESLVEEGEHVHERTRDAAEAAMSNAMSGIRGAVDAGVEGVRDRATETWDNIEKIFESRVHKALRQLGVPTAGDINSLSRKVNELTKSVDTLARKRSTPSRAPSRKSSRASSTEMRSVSLQRTKHAQPNA